MGDQAVSGHYGRGDLTGKILAALRAAGKDPKHLEPRDLSPIDQFHARGRRATLDLAHLAGVSPGMRVLDVGGGLGGPARTLVSEFGCSVEVLDLTEELCDAGHALTARTGLADLVSFRHGSALEMPYPDAGFDVAWTQHSSMNMADKERLYAEIHRVLRPNGLLALHEIMSGATSPIHLPVPWARVPALNHLRPPVEIRALISAVGFDERAWVDETASSTAWFRKRHPAPRPEGTQPLDLSLLLGPDFGEMLHNQVRNLEEGRIAVIQAAFEKR